MRLVPSPRDARGRTGHMTRRTRRVGTLVLTAAAIAYLVWKIDLGRRSTSSRTRISPGSRSP